MDDLQPLYDKYMEFTDEMMGDHPPMAVAGIMLAQALSIYKTALSSDDYEAMMDNISDLRDKVKTFDVKKVIQ